MCDANVLAFGCILFRVPKYNFLFETYIFFNLILIKISNCTDHFALVIYSFLMATPVIFPVMRLSS
jgi:hypothetical protein